MAPQNLLGISGRAYTPNLRGISGHTPRVEPVRAPLDFQEEAMARLKTFPEVCAAIKRALDPSGILSQGRYGIG